MDDEIDIFKENFINSFKKEFFKSVKEQKFYIDNFLSFKDNFTKFLNSDEGNKLLQEIHEQTIKKFIDKGWQIQEIK